MAHYLASQALPDYAHKFSRHDFTLPQLFACLVVKELLNPNFTSVGNWTPLMCAVAVDISNLDRDDMLQEVEQLLRAGASIVAMNDRGETAVDILNRQCSIDEGIKEQALALLRGDN